MRKDTLARLQRPFVVCVLLCFVLATSARADGQQQQGTAGGDDERARAFRLFDESKFTEALPLLEKLAAANGNDPGLLEKYGFALLAATQIEKDQKKRANMIERARAALLRSKELGNDSALLKAALEVAMGGGATGKTVFSENREADKAMHEGEDAHVQGELMKAAAAYERAFKLDAHLYEAPLFAGDMYFKSKDWDKAGEWFARAIGVDADRETAYRYWGDALMMGQNKKTESRDKFVDAVVAEPYNRHAWEGLLQWGQNYRVRLSHPRIEPPESVWPLKDNKVAIDSGALEKKDDGTSAWSFYSLTRATWKAEKFAREFPGQKTYRHTLREETEALRGVVNLVKQQTKEGKIKQLDPVLSRLVKLDDEGLLEAFILLAKPDDGIALDYVQYRKTNRDKLRRYMLEYVTAERN